MNTQAPTTFERPYRHPLLRFLNWMVARGERFGFHPQVSSEEFIRRAERQGKRQFANQDFRAGLDHLTAEFQGDTSAILPIGRYWARSSLLNCLRRRLVVEEALERYPEIPQRPVHAPLFVVGLPRTGTTVLYHLLCLDPQSRPLMIWETLSPELNPLALGKKRDPRRRKAQIYVRVLNRLAPQVKAMHIIEGDGPEECTWLMANTLCSFGFIITHRLPQYQQWYMSLPPEAHRPHYAFYRKTLQMLQWPNERENWVLKSPSHQFALDSLIEAFPDCGIIQTHRDPQRVIPSFCSLVSLVRGIYSEVDPKQVGAEIPPMIAEGLRRAVRVRQNDPGRFCDVQFQNFISDPVATLRHIYATFGREFTPDYEARVRKWLAENPRGKAGAHRYHHAQFGLTREQIDREFAEYRDRYGIPLESAD